MDAPPKKVLLVDDDADLIELHKIVLENNGYQVLVAYNGNECLRCVAAEMPDIIVLDVIMNTVCEGFDIARDLRYDEKTRHIPLIMLTSVNQFTPFKFEADPHWLPVDLFLEKPVPSERLLEEIAKRI